MDIDAVKPTVWQRAVALFGSEIKAAQWMTTRLAELGERSPEEVVADNPEAVEAILDRLQYGVLA